MRFPPAGTPSSTTMWWVSCAGHLTTGRAIAVRPGLCVTVQKQQHWIPGLHCAQRLFLWVLCISVQACMIPSPYLMCQVKKEGQRVKVGYTRHRAARDRAEWSPDAPVPAAGRTAFHSSGRHGFGRWGLQVGQQLCSDGDFRGEPDFLTLNFKCR